MIQDDPRFGHFLDVCHEDSLEYQLGHRSDHDQVALDYQDGLLWIHVHEGWHEDFLECQALGGRDVMGLVEDFHGELKVPGYYEDARDALVLGYHGDQGLAGFVEGLYAALKVPGYHGYVLAAPVQVLSFLGDLPNVLDSVNYCENFLDDQGFVNHDYLLQNFDDELLKILVRELLLVPHVEQLKPRNFVEVQTHHEFLYDSPGENFSILLELLNALLDLKIVPLDF